MCFSAPASFISSAILATIGATLSCQIKNKRLLPLALIPIFFAIQQCSEGIVWLYLGEASQSLIALGAKNVFLFFAFVIWPIWVPFAFWMAENNSWRKHVMGVCFGIGLVLSVILILTIPMTSAASYHNSIQYLNQWQSFPLEERINLVAIVFYGVAISLPFLISTLKKIWILGLLAILAGIIVYSIDRFFFTSVWCFFAAIISLGLFFIIPRNKQAK